MRLLIGVTGGIAAYKALETARLAVRAGHRVRVIATPTSERFVGAASFAAITGAPVLTSEFDLDPDRGLYPGESLSVAEAHTPISHLALIERADVYLIAPASANTIAKLAHGLADGLISTAALAADCPVIVAPAMNHRMYRHAATQANVAVLRERGVVVLEPGTGELASRGETGVGRLPEPADLLAALETAATAASDQRWLGRRVLVSAGGTREPIDPVRYIGNRSSGRMGFALARQARARGASVVLLSANVSLPAPEGVELVPVSSAAELQREAEARFGDADVLVMAAAVADFRPRHPAGHKLKKTSAEAPDRIELEPTPDILSGLSARRRPEQILVGFAAEHGPGALDYGRAKLARKSLDAIVVNDVARADIGFDTPDNEVTILTAIEERTVTKTTKDAVAMAILDTVDALIAARAPSEDGARDGGARH